MTICITTKITHVTHTHIHLTKYLTASMSNALPSSVSKSATTHTVRGRMAGSLLVERYRKELVMMEVISEALRAEKSSTDMPESLRLDSPVMSTYDELLVLSILSLSLIDGRMTRKGGKNIIHCCKVDAIP